MLKIGFHSFLVLLFPAMVCFTGCHSTSPSPPTLTYAQEEDFLEEKEASVKLHEGFTLDLWAPGRLLASPVSLTFTHQGEALVSETTRRKSSDIDIRQHRDWMTEELGLQSLEDTEAFHKKKLAIEQGKENTWQEDFNEDGSHDWRDLMVQSERIRRIWDEDGDGRADASNLFADGFKEMLTGVAAGIQVLGDEVFLACAPDLWRIQDTDGDGDADKKESISHGYGIHIGYAGHDMSGVTYGPDGKIYWSIGDLGVNVVDPTGKRWAYPHQGAVMRANPDGSEFEVFAHGLRNPQELAFDAFGNLISVDNDGDHPGEHERIVHILEGSDTGWRTYWQFGKYNKPEDSYKVWMDEKLHVPHFDGQAAYLLPPLALADNGPAGLAYNPGTALGEKWKGYFFSSHFTASSANSRIRGIKLEPKGASFGVAIDTLVSEGIVSTGLSFGPDGALYIADWLESYDKKPFGRIWKLDVESPLKSPLRRETKQLLSEGMKSRPETELGELLAHPDMRVRLEAQFELVKRKKTESLVKVAQSPKSLHAGLHALWGLGQLARKDRKMGSLILPFLQAAEGEIKAQAAKVLGDAHYAEAEKGLLALLQDSYPRAQYFAAEALGKIQSESAFEPLVGLLKTTQEKDPHMRHGLILALARSSSSEKISKLSSHSSPYVRIGAVVALRIQKSPLVAQFLGDSHPWVKTEAARAIHDDEGIEEAWEALAKAIGAHPADEAFERRAINANLLLGSLDAAQRLLDYAQNKQMPSEFRSDALWALSKWGKPPVLNRVVGRHLQPRPTNIDEAIQVLDPSLVALIQNSPKEVRVAALQVAQKLPISSVETLLPQLVKQRQNPGSVRIAALQAIVEQGHPTSIASMNVALTAGASELRREAQKLIPMLNVETPQKVEMLQTALNYGSMEEKQQILASLGSLDHPSVEEVLTPWVDKFEEGKVDKHLALDVFMAVESSPFETLKQRTQAVVGKEGPEFLYTLTMNGGEKSKGRRILTRHQTAQCLRCHQIGTYGGVVGPPLTHIGSQLNRKELMESLVNPSKRLAPGYGSFILSLKNGEKVSGTLVKSGSDSLFLRLASEEIKGLSLDDIEKQEPGPSAMPSMQHILNLSEIRDLVEFLTSLTIES